MGDDDRGEVGDRECVYIRVRRKSVGCSLALVPDNDRSLKRNPWLYCNYRVFND